MHRIAGDYLFYFHQLQSAARRNDGSSRPALRAWLSPQRCSRRITTLAPEVHALNEQRRSIRPLFHQEQRLRSGLVGWWAGGMHPRNALPPSQVSHGPALCLQPPIVKNAIHCSVCSGSVSTLEAGLTLHNGIPWYGIWPQCHKSVDSQGIAVIQMTTKL